SLRAPPFASLRTSATSRPSHAPPSLQPPLPHPRSSSMPSTVRLDIPVLLPEAPDALDACVERLVKRLTGAPGLSQIHVAESPTGPQLCLHYDAKLLSPDEVRRKALQAGVEISRRF